MQRSSGELAKWPHNGSVLSRLGSAFVEGEQLSYLKRPSLQRLSCTSQLCGDSAPLSFSCVSHAEFSCTSGACSLHNKSLHRLVMW